MGNMNKQTRKGYSTGEPRISAKQKREDDLQEAKQCLAEDLKEFIDTKTGYEISDEKAADIVVQIIEEIGEWR